MHADSDTQSGAPPLDDLGRDILDQPRSLRETLDAIASCGGLAAAAAHLAAARRVLWTGMGASLYALYPAYLRHLDAGGAGSWIETGELLHHAAGRLGPDTAVVCASQSGRSAEVVRLAEAAREAGARLLAITNAPDSPLGRAAAVTLGLCAGPEAGCATKTHTSTLAAADTLAAAAVGQTDARARWDGAAASLQQLSASRAHWLGNLTRQMAAAQHLWLLARGPSLAAALGGALMLKESNRLHSEGMSVPAFRHGPLEGALPGRHALVFVTPGAIGRLDLDLAQELMGYGMEVATFAPGRPPEAGVPTIALPATPGGTEPLLNVAVVQWLGHALALQRGVVPGHFERIEKVTTRE